MKDIIQSRLDAITEISYGSHSGEEYSYKNENAPAMCVMEAVAWVTGENWSDNPSCVDAALMELAIGINDMVSDTVRQKFIPLIPHLINTRYDGLGDQRVDWFIEKTGGHRTNYTTMYDYIIREYPHLNINDLDEPEDSERGEEMAEEVYGLVVDFFAEMVMFGKEKISTEEEDRNNQILGAMANQETTVEELLGLANKLDKVLVAV